MKVHPKDTKLEDLLLRRLPNTSSLRLQRHLFKCSPCLQRLTEIEKSLGLMERSTDRSQLTSRRKPLFIVHNTIDGPVFSQAKRRGRRWFARHWGKDVSGGQAFKTLEEANEYLSTSFCQMFPEHREVSASLRDGAFRFTNRSGSVSHVFREQGIHIVADTIAEVVADDAHSIQAGD
jgi:hypothetical protein